MGYEVEVDDFPHGDVADGGDEGDQDAAGEGAAEGDLAREIVVAVAADTEVDKQKRRHHDGVAENHAVAGANLVGDEERATHQDGNDNAGNEAEGEDAFLHTRLLVTVAMDSRCSVTRADVVTLSNDFAGMARKSCFWVMGVTAGGLFLAAFGRPGRATIVKVMGLAKLRSCFDWRRDPAAFSRYALSWRTGHDSSSGRR